MKIKTLLLCALLCTTGLLLAHPHFSKTVAAEMDGQELRLNFTTYPFSEDHLSQVTEGFVFHCGRATLSLASDLSSGTQTLPAGEYLVRAKANSLDDWTLILIPAAHADADPSNGVPLQSTTLTGLPTSHHLDLDLYSGHGPTDGKLILAVSFGDRKVEGLLELG